MESTALIVEILFHLLSKNVGINPPIRCLKEYPHNFKFLSPNANTCYTLIMPYSESYSPYKRDVDIVDSTLLLFVRCIRLSCRMGSISSILLLCSFYFVGDSVAEGELKFLLF